MLRTWHLFLVACLLVYPAVVEQSTCQGYWQAELLSTGATSPVETGLVEEKLAEAQASAADAGNGDLHQLPSLVEQLGAASSAERRDAFRRILSLGTAAQVDIDRAALSSHRQVAESAKQLQVLLKVVDKCHDPAIALEVADLFLQANEQNIAILASRGLWDLAEFFLDQHDSIATRCQEKFFEEMTARELIGQLVDAAQQQGALDRSWRIIARLIPIELAYWTAKQLDYPQLRLPQDQHDRALELFFAGDVEQALQLDIPMQLRIRLAARGFQWKTFADPQVQQAHLGSQEDTCGLAARAVLTEMSGDFAGADLLWRRALGVGDEVSPFSSQERHAAVEALKREAPISSDSSILDKAAVVLKPAGFYQLQLALLMSGRVAAIDDYLQQERAASSFSVLARSDYRLAFELIGLQADLSNFDSWLTQQLLRARQGVRDFERSQESNLGQLIPATNLGQAASLLANLGERDHARRILSELITLCNKTRVESDAWNRIITRWLHSDSWRDLCLEVIGSQFEQIRQDHRSGLLDRLYPQLSDCAFELLLHSPAAQERSSQPDWTRAFEQLSSLQRCDRNFFGPQATNVVRAWLYGAAASGTVPKKEVSTDDQEGSPVDSSTLLGLAKLARDWDDLTTAINLLAVHGENLWEFDHFRFAAQAMLEQRQPDTALQYLKELPVGTSSDHWRSLLRQQSFLALGDLEAARREIELNWLRFSSLSSDTDRSAGYRVVEDLLEQHEPEAAIEYAERIFLTDRTVSFYSFWQTRQYALALQGLKQHQHSADVLRSLFIEMLKPSSQVVRYLSAVNDLDIIRYSAVRERISRAIYLIEQQDTNAAIHHLQVAYQMHPQDVEAVVHCFPLLIQAGLKDEADLLFDRFESALLSQITNWPNDAMSLNNLAWMYAKSGQKLDEALKLSTQAVKLVPSSAVYLDTLAEVQFQRGEVEQALQSMRGCIQLDPRERGYRQNLMRYSSR